tara:strand:- start:56455 stop:58107 length:1653 start_codon:yes stop_codon:yes gene_type:complete
MAFNSGTGITDHIAMLDKLTEVVTGRFLETVVVNAGGTGHAIGDIIEIDATGSTSTILAQLEVTSVAAGVIDGIRVYRSGVYTVDPTTTTANAQSGTSGSGISATFDITMSAPVWAVNRRTQQAASAVISAGGTGYVVGELLTIDLAGVKGFHGVSAIFRVASLSGSAVATLDLGTGSVVGNYEEVPTGALTTTASASGTGCTLTVTWEDGTKAENDHQMCMLEGEGLAGADEIHVCIRPVTAVQGFDNSFNWGLIGMTGYNAGIPVHQQVGVNSKAINITTGDLPTVNTGSYVILKDDDADPDMEWWINWNGRRMIMVCKVEGSSSTFYASMYLGFINQFGTDTEYPYPLWLCGNYFKEDTLWTNTSEVVGGIVEVTCASGASSSKPNGPGFLRHPDGTWNGHAGTSVGTTGTARAVSSNFSIYPFGNPPTQGQGINGTVGTSNGTMWQAGSAMIPATGVPGVPGKRLKPTPGTGDPYYWLIAPILTKTDDTFPTDWQLFGEIDGVFWFSTGDNGIVSEDRFVQDGKRYTIFANGNRTQEWSYFALDED